MPATPTSAISSVLLPIRRAVIAAPRRRGDRWSRRKRRDGAFAYGGLGLLEGDGTGAFMVGGARLGAADCFEGFAGGSRSEDVAAGIGHVRENARYLIRGFARREDDLWHAGPQGAMMIELGEAEVFEGEVLETFERIRHGSAIRLDLVEQRLQLPSGSISAPPRGP